MKLLKNAMATAKAMPKGVWIAAIVIPGGLTAAGIWFIAKGAYKTLRGKK